MIRPFNKLDARRIKPNGFSGTGDMSFVFDDPTFFKQTLEDENGAVVCIMCFKSYWENNYVGFFLIGLDIQPVHARVLKRFMENVILDFNMERLQTDSVDCELLNRWHKFLGFELEGKRRKMIMGKDFNMWAIVPEAVEAPALDASKCGGL